MDKIDFCHLHAHSIGSVLDGMVHPKQYAQKAKELGFKYTACTDHGNFDMLIKFQKACKDEGIIPISGIEIYLVDEWRKDSPRGHMTLWIKNQKGFKNLTKIVTESNLNGFYYRPRVDFKTLLKYHKGLVIGSACIATFIKICNGGKKFFHQLREIKKDDIYLEVMPHNMPLQIKRNKFIEKLAKKTNTKIIITQDCHYLNKQDWKAHEVLLAMQRKAKWTDKNRWKFEIKGFHFRSLDEMIKAAKKIDCYNPEYFNNTIEIAEKCKDFVIERQDIELPSVPGIDPKNEDKELWKLIENGYRDIFNNEIRRNKIYYERAKFEFEVIKNKKFERYFLIVWELCNWCKKNNIPVGPRGSVGGSLIARCLKITTLDPIQHGLIFDRFINKDRIDFPDIDMDFPDTKRYLIQEHLENVYGVDKIAGVSTFGRLKPRASIQGVARVFDIPNAETNAFTKLIDDKEEDCINITINENKEAKEYAEKYPSIIKYARLLEGNISHYGKHAAALIVSNIDIAKSNRCSLLERNGMKLINWEKDDAEYVGLMKLDALGLKELTIISETLELIKRNRNEIVDLEKINIEDKNILNEISNGNTVGIFQFNTWGITNLVKQMGIEKFSHMSDAIALFRPGPLNSGMTDEYVARKNGKKWQRKNEIYEDIVKDTQGIICYQEQIINVINKIGAMPYSEADSIRKIISKKRDKKEFRKYEKKFLKGCKKQELFSKQEAKDFWEMLQSHARYSFNLCIDGNESIKRVASNHHKNDFTIAEMYKIKNDVEYARLTNHYELHHKWNNYGHYGYGISLNNDGIARKNLIKDIRYIGIKKLYKVTLKNNKTINITKFHKFPTPNGEKELYKLKIGDYLYICGDYEKDNGNTYKCEIINIEYIGKKEVYDIEMDAPNHTFVTRNNIITSNSHSTAYALVAFWTAYLKYYYPTEFICSALTYCAKTKKKELIEEAYRLGLQLKLPKVNISNPIKWVSKDNKLFIPFKEIKGLGDKKALIASKSPEIEKKDDNGKSRFSKKEIVKDNKHKGKLGELLDSIGAYDENEEIKITDEIKKIFEFRIVLNPRENYKRLYELFNYDIELKELDPILNGNIPKKFRKNADIIKKKTFDGFNDLNRCNQCELYNQCTRPVHPSPGKYNIMIIGEAPGFWEDSHGRGFYEKAKSGRKLWSYIKKSGYSREMFHVSNVVHCFPSKSKKPNNEQIKICTDLWLRKEIKKVKPIVILAFGNTSRQFFEGINTGIMSISGKTIWNEEFNCWICYCLHPAGTLYNPDNEQYFIAGMKNFIKLLRNLGLKKAK